MPFLSSSLPPPAPATLPSLSASTASRSSAAKTPFTKVKVAPVPPPSEEPPASTVSRVALDVDTISFEVAAELAGALVGHVLFLKSQIPFPVMQLSRIPSGKTNPRALKLRTELLSAFDTLSSHLNTTFPALATAFALVSGGSGTSPRPTRRAYLAILVGPSIGSAKTRVMLALDGVVPRVWGERNDDGDGVEEGDESDDDESEDEDDDEEDDEESGSDSSLRGPSPPPSRSPSPSPCTSPSPTSPPPPSGPSPHQLIRLLAHTLATAPHSMAAELAPSQTHILLRAPRRFAHPAWIPRQAASPALEGVLHQFRAQAGDVPSTITSQTVPTKPRRTAKGLDVEGAWVTCRRGGVEFPDAHSRDELGGDGGAEKENETKKGVEEEKEAKEVEEADEMIWWSWDGKIVGFADW
ncbi:hypothetical protein C8R46DRAFT_997018 [Mycena filopes]|nr:hypothetical protein C8R46DRAFT_997018 [Mycena filopes]